MHEVGKKNPQPPKPGQFLKLITVRVFPDTCFQRENVTQHTSQGPTHWRSTWLTSRRQQWECQHVLNTEKSRGLSCQEQAAHTGHKTTHGTDHPVVQAGLGPTSLPPLEHRTLGSTEGPSVGVKDLTHKWGPRSQAAGLPVIS